MEKFKRIVIKYNNKKNKIASIILCISIVMLITSFTYAYFIFPPNENESENVTMKSGTLSLTLRDNDDTVENLVGSWNFGDTIEKELIIENTGTLPVTARVYWDNLINTYSYGSLTYTLEESQDNGNSFSKIIREKKFLFQKQDLRFH